MSKNWKRWYHVFRISAFKSYWMQWNCKCIISKMLETRHFKATLILKIFLQENLQRAVCFSDDFRFVTRHNHTSASDSLMIWWCMTQMDASSLYHDLDWTDAVSIKYAPSEAQMKSLQTRVNCARCKNNTCGFTHRVGADTRSGDLFEPEKPWRSIFRRVGRLLFKLKQKFQRRKARYYF